MTITDRLAAQDRPTIPVPPPEYIHVGSRAGVQWRCYREPGETLEQWEQRAEIMRAALVEY